MNVNMAYNKNEVTEVNNANHFIEGGNDLLAQSKMCIRDSSLGWSA